jgi:transposase
VLIETFIRKQLGLKAHRVTAVEEAERRLLIRIDRLGRRRLTKATQDVRPERRWLDLSMRGVAMVLHYRPRRVRCRRCGVRVEAFPWAEPWARVTRALAGAVVALARSQSWRETAQLYGLNWKSVAGLVQRALEYGLAERRSNGHGDVERADFDIAVEPLLQVFHRLFADEGFNPPGKHVGGDGHSHQGQEQRDRDPQ